MLEVQGLSKKFSRNLHQSMIYGARDVLSSKKRLIESSKELRKGEFWALDEVSFNLKKGEILGIIGTNGSGKSTLMRLLSGIYTPDKGSFLINPNFKVTPLFSIGSGLNFVLSGKENVFLKGLMYGMSRKEVEEKMEFIVEFSELEGFMETPLGAYSNGMRARLAYATALATDPDIFLIDEALAVGDPRFKLKCFQNLREIAPEKGIIIVSNSMRKILKVATRVLIMEKGKFVFETEDANEAVKVFSERLQVPNGEDLSDID